MSLTLSQRGRRVSATQPPGLCSSPEELCLFAIETIDQLVEISKSIQKASCRASQFCRTLESVLWTVKSHLQKQHQEQDVRLKKVEGLLNNLERLCVWPRPSRQDVRNSANRWPTLRSLQDGKRRATECLRNFAAKDDNQNLQFQLLQKLEGFSGKNSKYEASDATPGTSSTSPAASLLSKAHDLDDDIQCLCSTLRQYRSCDIEGSCGDILTNIRLNAYRSMITDDATAEFGVLFFDHPHAGQCHWQEACIQIRHQKTSRAPKVRFEDDRTHPLDRSRAANAHITCSNFCTNISGRIQAQLVFPVQNNKFSSPEVRDTSRNWLLNQPSISLAALLDKKNAKFTGKMKSILALLLAKATWQFYDSELIGQGLSKDNVHFLYEERSNTHGVFINEPMLVMRFSESDTSSKNEGDVVPTTVIHDMPKMLALGLLLLELETETSMETYLEEANIHSGPININTYYKIGKNLVDEQHPSYVLSDILAHSPLHKVLPMCIRAGELARRLNATFSAEKHNSSDIHIQNALRAVIYTDIVKPLQDWVENYPHPNVVKALYKLSDTAPVMSPRNIVSPHILVQSAPQAHETPKMSQDDELRRQSRVWFQQYEELKDVLQPQTGERGTEYEPIKIAVLDTGINVNDYDYYRDYGLIKDYVDYVGTDDGKHALDETGHGSTAVSLIIKTCPNANLYLARVLQTNSATFKEVENVVKAIDWAVDHGVDIITMALGFKEDQPLITEAIGRARGKQILVFSAASNGRNIDPIYFPAKRSDQVFGIFSTNAGIRESRSLNPSPGNRPYSFAIFGEDIEVMEGEKLLRGTSFSTSIAAGLAAMLLDFSRQEAQRATILQVKEMQGMIKVLGKMAKSDGQYACICPWRILKDNYKSSDGSSMSEMRQKQREWIRGTIERLLEDMYEDAI